VADFGTVDVFYLAVRHLADIAVASDTGHRSVDRLMKKIGINIIVIQCALVIVYPEPAVFMAEKAILRIPGKQFRAEAKQEGKQAETKR